MYTNPWPGFREGSVREGLGRGNALSHELFTLHGLLVFDRQLYSAPSERSTIRRENEGRTEEEGRRKGHTVPTWLYLIPNPD